MQSPPLDGSIPVLPGFTDFQAEHNPSSPCLVFPSRRSAGETSSVSFFEFAQATHRMAHALRPGRRGDDGEVVTILVNCDTLLYAALVVGAVRAGLVPFPMSPRNSPEAIYIMLARTGCHRIITQPSLTGLISAVEAHCSSKKFPLQVDQLPALDAIFPQFSVNPVLDIEPYPSTLKPRLPDDTVLYLHSSGSTGFPKPVPQTERRILQRARFPLMEETGKHKVKWAAMTLPTFHTMGFFLQIYVPMTTGMPVAIYTPQAPAPPVVPNPANVFDTAKLLGCDGIPVVPSFIEVWAQSDEAIKFLTTLQVLIFAGGPLSAENGGKLAAAGVKLYAIYGGTEFGAPNRLFDTDDSQGPDADLKTSADWAWMQFSDLTRTNWIPQGDGTYELQFLTCDTHEPSVENLTNPKGYATADLFIPHPKKKGLWRIVGRADDVVVLGSGEKIVPIPQESYLVSTKFASGAVIFGRGQTQAGVLIEPRPEYVVDPNDEKSLVDFRNKIWPSVEAANKLAPSFARIFKETIIVTDSARPMLRAAKGTVMRRLTLTAYEKDIENLYKTVEASANSHITPPKSWSAKDVEAWLIQHAESIHEGKQVDPGRDIFEQGFDSLGATFLRNRITATLRTSTDASAQNAAAEVPSSFIFMNSTLQGLATAVANLVHPDSAITQNGSASGSDDIRRVLEKYSSILPSKFPQEGSETVNVVVLLTGSTGSLGSHILTDLLPHEGVTKVFTLNRASSVEHRQRSAFEERGLPVDLLSSSKLVELVGDLSHDDLGLDKDVFTQLKHSVTHIIHNAWKVDFNLSLYSFESHIAGTCKLIELCASSTQPVKIFYTSSFAVARKWNLLDGAVPEAGLPNPDVAAGQGYSASKYVVEQLLARASEKGLAATSLRIGQISGSSKTGTWPTTEWVPILIKSSIALRSLPLLDNVVSWIPMDTVSGAVVDYVFTTDPLPVVLNLVHPHPATWKTALEAVNNAFPSKLPFIPFEEWYTKLDALSANPTADCLGRVPALKLLDFFRGLAKASTTSTSTQEAGGLPHFDTTKSQKFSPTLRNAPSVGREQAALWVQYWRKTGFIS